LEIHDKNLKIGKFKKEIVKLKNKVKKVKVKKVKVKNNNCFDAVFFCFTSILLAVYDQATQAEPWYLSE
jgi:hypothetical protein